ncbi:MAG: hypothetical protein ABJP45_10315 [Cyclobacteriaceae bacterium]
MKYLTTTSAILILAACTSTQSQTQGNSYEIPEGFNDYWYAGEAELTSFELQQARYGEIHSGEAVLVFVTEPFSGKKQVKLDNWRDESADNVSVMKLNFNKKFLTGIYPYSMMSSTFTPISTDKHPDILKVTTSSQEWCGHTFMQFNLQDKNYRLQGFSYFESEGDFDIKIPKTILEDEIWTRIRFNPNNLPIGGINVLPGSFYLRLRHQEVKPQKADAQLQEMTASEFSGEKHMRYLLEYENRSLAIYFNTDFPFEILGWEETYLSGFGEPQQLTTKAKRISSIKSAYWGKNSNADREIRKELGLRAE